MTLYPRVSEKGEEEVISLMESFKEKMASIAEDVIGNLYTDVTPYIESDAWTNFKNTLMDGLTNPNTKNNEYDFKKIRQTIYNEYKEELIKGLDKDLVKENERLKETLEFERSLNRRYS